MLIARKGGVLSITYAEALDIALRWGWIDGQKRGGDPWKQKFGPRGLRSIWSKINRDKALALIAQGEMQPAGLAAVERAKANGMWDRAYDAQSKTTIPDDLAAAFAATPAAATFYATLDSRNRYAVLHRLQLVKRADTRARRIAEFVAKLARGEKFH